MSAPFSYHLTVRGKECIVVWRILMAACLLAAALCLSSLAAEAQNQAQPPVAAPSVAQTPSAAGASGKLPTLQPATDAVGIVVMVANGAVSTLDISFPGPVTMAQISSDLKQVTQWTGWAVGAPQCENTGGANSAHVVVTGATPIQGMLDDVVWPLVAALAEHGRIGIVIMGAQVATPSLKIENRYVTLEQSGGQGVQSYQAFVKDPGFNTLAELKRQEAPGAASARPGGKLALAWILILVASVATGVAVYLFMGRSGAKR